MLEIYRSCPKCSAHLEATADRCGCGQRMGAAFGQPEVSKLRGSLDWVILCALLGVMVAGMLRPDWYQAVAGGRVVESVRAARAGRPIWSHPGDEPKARAWAWKLESSLEKGCSKTFLMVAEKKLVGGMLNFQLVGGTLAASKHTQEIAKKNLQKIPWMTPDEVADAAAAVGRYDDFFSNCLARGYQAIGPCERFQEALGSAEAATCLVPPVQRMLSGLAWRTCAANARMPRVKELCEVTAQRLEALQQGPGQAQALQQQPGAPGI